MAEKPAAERTEQPTPRRLRKAREKGQVAQSRELPSALSVIVLIGVLTLMSGGLLEWFIDLMQEGMRPDRSVFASSDAFMSFAGSKIIDSMLLISPIFVALCTGSIAACVVVGGLNFSMESINLKADSIDPVKGFGRLFNGKALVKLCISVAKLVFVGLIAWLYLNSKRQELLSLRWAWSLEIIIGIGRLVLGMMIRLCVALLVIAAIDVLYQRWKYTQDLKMTRQEVKEEHKETEGSPELKSRIRSVQIQMAKKRMLQEVPEADVVLVNPTHVAVALKYDATQMDSPRVVAKGADYIAEKIREIARSYGVPVIRKPELARTIYSSVEQGDPIPENLYVAVAEVLAMIYRLRQRVRG